MHFGWKAFFSGLKTTIISTVMVPILNVSEGAGQFTKKTCEIIETVFIIVWKLYTFKVVENSRKASWVIKEKFA